MTHALESVPPQSQTGDRRLRYLLREQFESCLDEYDPYFAGTSFSGRGIRQFMFDTGSSSGVLNHPSVSAYAVLSGEAPPIAGIALESFPTRASYDSFAAGILASTSQPSTSTNIEEVRFVTATFGRLIDASREETFQDGYETNLSLGLQILIRRYPKSTLTAFVQCLRSKSIGEAMLGHLLRALGWIDDERSRLARLNVLAGFLRNSSAYIRDAATLALSYIGDRAAIPFLQAAIDVEKNATLRIDMIAALKTLDE